MKRKIINTPRTCIIDLELTKRKATESVLDKLFNELPIKIRSRNISETKSNVSIHIICQIKKEIDIVALKKTIQSIVVLEKISVSENLRQR